jgi:hypothetical protein
MKNVNRDDLDSALRYWLATDKTITLGARKLQIECRQGVVWVTWPYGNERVLKQGQAMAVVSKGLICVQAFSPSAIVVRGGKTNIFRRWVPHRPSHMDGRCPVKS